MLFSSGTQRTNIEKIDRECFTTTEKVYTVLLLPFKQMYYIILDDDIYLYII